MSRVLPITVSLLVGSVLLAGCGGRKSDPAPPAPSSSSPDTPASGSGSGGLPGPPSPLSVVLESKGPLLLSGLEGGVLVTDVAHTHLARAGAGGELAAEPMPEGLPEGPGRILLAAGRAPAPVWLVYEKLREDGKVDANPLFRLGKEGLKKYADDWKPALAPWTKHRILAASTSSGKLKIKVIEPSLPGPPPDLPSAHLDDASCEHTLRIETLAALSSGEVLAAGTCKPDVAAGAGASPARYVVIRWSSPGAPAGAAADAGHLEPGGDGGVDERPGHVEVMPGLASDLTHAVLHARSAGDVWVGGSKLFHHDGASWGAVALPPAVAAVRGLAVTEDGTVWMATEHALWRRAGAGAWEDVPPPSRAGDPAGAWEMLGVVALDGRDVWIAARRTAVEGPRDLILRLRAAPAVVRWE